MIPIYNRATLFQQYTNERAYKRCNISGYCSNRYTSVLKKKYVNRICQIPKFVGVSLG